MSRKKGFETEAHVIKHFWLANKDFDQQQRFSRITYLKEDWLVAIN